MENYKVRVSNISEADIAQHLFEDIGYRKAALLDMNFPKLVVAVCNGDDKYSSGANFDYAQHLCQEITIRQLVDLAASKTKRIPYLVKTIDKWEEQQLTSDTPESATCLKIPDGAIEFLYSESNNSRYHFVKSNGDLMSITDILYGKEYWYEDKFKYKNWDSVSVVWQRQAETIPTHPEELPFIDDEPKHDDNVNNPSHYTQGSIECIEALEAATVNKHGIEAVCVANVIKYLWRYESKNGLEDVKKAQWYLRKLVDKLEQNNG